MLHATTFFLMAWKRIPATRKCASLICFFLMESYPGYFYCRLYYKPSVEIPVFSHRLKTKLGRNLKLPFLYVCFCRVKKLGYIIKPFVNFTKYLVPAFTYLFHRFYLFVGLFCFLLLFLRYSLCMYPRLVLNFHDPSASAVLVWYCLCLPLCLAVFYVSPGIYFACFLSKISE